jgi:hypothetical protein
VNTAATLPAIIHIKRRHFISLVVAIAVLTAAISGTLVTVASDHRPARAEASGRTTEEVLAALDPGARRYVESVMALSPLQRAAVYGRDPLDVLQLDPRSRQYVEAIMALTPEQLAAGFGNLAITRGVSGGAGG